MSSPKWITSTTIGRMKNRPSSAVVQRNEARHCQWKRCIRVDWAASTPAWALIDWNSWGVNSLVWKGVLLVCLVERVSSSLAEKILGVINYGMMCLAVPGRKGTSGARWTLLKWSWCRMQRPHRHSHSAIKRLEMRMFWGRCSCWSMLTWCFVLGCPPKIFQLWFEQSDWAGLLDAVCSKIMMLLEGPT